MCQSSDTNPHQGICRLPSPTFPTSWSVPATLQTQDHRNNFHCSSWGSFTSEPITSANLPSTETQSSFLLTLPTKSSQFQVLNGSDCPFSTVTTAIILVETLLPVWITARASWGASLPPGLLPSNTASTVLPVQYFQRQSWKCHSLLQTREQFLRNLGSNLNSSVHQSKPLRT